VEAALGPFFLLPRGGLFFHPDRGYLSRAEGPGLCGYRKPEYGGACAAGAERAGTCRQRRLTSWRSGARRLQASPDCLFLT
jgi:hypothetical protein